MLQGIRMQIPSHAPDRDAEGHAGAIVHEMKATRILFGKISDRVKAYVPAHMILGFLRALPDRSDRCGDDRFDDDFSLTLRSLRFHAPALTTLLREFLYFRRKRHQPNASWKNIASAPTP